MINILKMHSIKFLVCFIFSVCGACLGLFFALDTGTLPDAFQLVESFEYERKQEVKAVYYAGIISCVFGVCFCSYIKASYYYVVNALMLIGGLCIILFSIDAGKFLTPERHITIPFIIMTSFLIIIINSY